MLVKGLDNKRALPLYSQGPMKSKHKKIIIIVGPTASGKSDLAIILAQKFKGEIISADSRQVYRGMDIGTGKVSKMEQKLVPHYLLDVTDPKRVFTVTRFQKLGTRAINHILKNKKLPIIVGGTGHYIDALVYGFNLPEVPPNPKLRVKLEKLSTEQLFRKLLKLDPARAKSIDPHNPRRLIRALEIIKATGQPVGEIKKESNYEIFWLGLNPKNLDQRITKRLLARLRQGLVAEVKKLKAHGLSSKRLDDLGLEYRWVGQFLNKEISAVQMISGLNTAIRQYSKRQMTWFKRNKNIHWLDRPDQAEKLIQDFLN